MTPHAALFRWMLTAVVAATCLSGCAWAPGALCLDHFIHHRNYRAAKIAWLTYGHADLGPWAATPACKDFETGWRQGYYDVAGGMDGKRPIMPPRRYWAARYQNPAGQKQVEAWFAGYELGAAAAQRDGIGNWSYVPTSLGAPPEQPYEEPGSIGYRVLPHPEGFQAEEDRLPAAEPVRPADREPVGPAPSRAPRSILPRQGLPAPSEAPQPQPAEPPSGQPAETEAAPTEAQPSEELPEAPAAVPGDPFAEEPSTDEARPETPPLEEAPPEEPLEEPLDAAPSDAGAAPPPGADESTKAPADAPADALDEPSTDSPPPADDSEPGRTTPAIPRRDVPFPPPRTAPRQPGQPIRPEGELKGLDTDEPLPEATPEERQGAAAVRRPASRFVVATKTVPAAIGRNRLRLAHVASAGQLPDPPPAAAPGEQASARAKTERNERPREQVRPAGATQDDGDAVMAAVHTAGESESPAADLAEGFATQQTIETDESTDVLGGLSMIQLAPDAWVENAAAGGNRRSEQPPVDDDLFFGLQGLVEPPAESSQP